MVYRAAALDIKNSYVCLFFHILTCKQSFYAHHLLNDLHLKTNQEAY